MDAETTNTLLQSREQDILKQLTELLRGYGEKILSGQSKLSLTTRSLCILNDSFTAVLGEDELVTSFDVLLPNSPKLHLAQDIQFLYDFMQKTIALKIIHISSTLQGRVNLGPFKALRTLEIKKTPLHLLEGIQRMRGRLSTIVCSRSLSSLQELFETCGGDLSSPMSWPELRTACLSFNMIEKLDTSLRLVPGLEILDLSHNSIKDTDHCLEYLTEVSMVNLGYNKIVQVPTFAISSRAKLSTLILRNNNLENLSGLQDLVGLRELDVSDNCLCEHSTLAPLRSLHRLGLLLVRGNPLSYHDDHRLLAIIQLNRTAVNRVTMDGQAITQTEIQAAQKLSANSSSMSRSPGSGGNTTLTSRGSHSSLDYSYESMSHVESNGRKGRTRTTTRAGVRRVRQAPISDLDSGCDAESDLPVLTSDTSKPSTPPVREHLDVKKHMETMRSQLGPDWLQTLVHSRRQTAQAAHSPTLTHNSPHPPTSLSLPNGIPTAPRDVPAAPCSSVVERDVPAAPCGSVVERERVAQFAVGSLQEEESDNEEEEILAGNCELSAKQPPPPVNYNYPPSHRNSQAGLVENSDTISDHIDINGDPKSDMTNAAGKTRTTSALVKSAEFDTIYDQQRHQSHSDEVDYGVESEPFIVSPLSDADTEHLVSVTQRYLLEKDINGDVIEALDLRCLQRAEVLAFGAVAEDGLDVLDDHEGHVLKLTFDHVRKDKRERLYLIEDETSIQALQELLQPVVEANQAEANFRDQMQCLKCSREFSKQQCARTIRRHGSVTASSDIYSTSAERGDLREALLCPFCRSDMLIKKNSGQRRQGMLVYTPVGSFKEPMATSSANPSPWKRTDSPINVPDQCRPVFGSFKSGQDAASFHSAMDTPMGISPKDSLFLTPSSSQSDLTFRTVTDAGDITDMSDVRPLSSTPEEGAGKRASTEDNVLKTVYMSQSVIEVSSSQTSLENTDMDSSVTTPTENRAFQRNFSGQDQGRHRRRKDSGSSDILVLSRHPNLYTFPSQDSDITLLSNPSQSSIAVIDSAVCSRETLNDLDADAHFLFRRPSINLEIVKEGGDFFDPHRDTDLSPAGSLTNKTLSSMVSSVYEKSIFDSGSVGSGMVNDSENGDDTLDGVTVVSESEPGSSYKSTASTPRVVNLQTNPFSGFRVEASLESTNENRPDPDGPEDLTPTPTSGVNPILAGVLPIGSSEDPTKIRFCYTDFSQIDHRLKLYLMMTLCRNEDEEILLVNRCGLWHYAKAEEVAGLVVVSSNTIYFFKINGTEKADNPEKWLKLMQSQAVVELSYVDIGINYQNMRLEFGAESICFILLMRDECRCKRFTSQFTAHVQSVAFNHQSRLKGITKNNPVTMENLRAQVLENEEDEEDELENEGLVLFVMAYQHTGEISSAGVKSQTAVSVVVTPSWLHLVDENLNWPAPRGMPTARGQQFTRKDRQKVTDITHMDLFPQSAPVDINISFYDEQSSEECEWRLTMETEDSLTSLVTKVKELWEEQFGVDLQINNEEL